MCALPGVTDHPLQINLLFAVRAGLLFTNNTPTSDAEFMKDVIAGKLVSVFNEPFFIELHNDFLSTDGTDAV